MKRASFSLNAAFTMTIPDFISRVHLAYNMQIQTAHIR
jgi:hypothetical protein